MNHINIKQPLLFCSLFLCSLMAGSYISHADEIEAGEVQILRVTSDAMDGYTDIKLIMDENNSILKIRYQTSDNQVKDFDMTNLQTGVVLLEKSGYDVVKLRGQNLSAKAGGELELIYLTSAITGSYSTFNMELTFDGNRWGLRTNDQSGRRDFTSMFMKARKLFGQVVGIEEVTVS